MLSLSYNSYCDWSWDEEAAAFSSLTDNAEEFSMRELARQRMTGGKQSPEYVQFKHLLH